MKATRYSTSRQKACIRCSAAKLKCDRKPGCCSRCAAKDVICSYTHTKSPGTRDPTASNTGDIGAIDRSDAANGTLYASDPALDAEALGLGAHANDQIPELSLPNISDSASSSANDSHLLSDSHLIGATSHQDVYLPGLSNGDSPLNAELCCPVDADAIRNRWLNAYLPVPGQKTKEYSAPISAFIYRILKSYAAVVTHGKGVPSFVHHSQVTSNSTSPPLATCLTLARMCEKPLLGSEGVAMEILQREMSNTYEQHDKYDDVGSLAAFQAYLIYSMILYFHLGQSQNPTLREAMMNLQHLACATSRRGLMCIAEQHNARPRWEAWVLVEAKRRTLYTMYLFDNVLSAQDGLPTALGTELTGLPAPSNKQLWSAQSRRVWETAYNNHLTDFEQGLRIDELWPVPASLDDTALRERRRRIDQWLQDVDEYGTMLYAVTSCTHGG